MGFLLRPVRTLVLAVLGGLLLTSLVPDAFGWHTTVVMSGSMAPAVQPGDMIIAAPLHAADASRLAKGTVLLVADPTHPGSLLLHRLVGWDARGRIITKGDASKSADSTHLRPEALVGQARLRIPKIGLPVLWVRERQKVPLACLGAFLLLLFVGIPWPRPRPAPRR